MATRQARFVGTAQKLEPRHNYRWQERSACQGAPEVDKAAFTGYPSKETAKDLKRRYCDRCPVRTQCLNWAYDDWAFTGVAGGMMFAGEKSSGKNRRAIKINAED